MAEEGRVLLIMLTLLGVGALLGTAGTYVVVSGIMPWWMPISTVSLVLFALFWGGPKMLDAQEQDMRADDYDRRDG